MDINITEKDGDLWYTCDILMLYCLWVFLPFHKISEKTFLHVFKAAVEISGTKLANIHVVLKDLRYVQHLGNTHVKI